MEYLVLIHHSNFIARCNAIANQCAYNNYTATRKHLFEGIVEGIVSACRNPELTMSALMDLGSKFVNSYPAAAPVVGQFIVETGLLFQNVLRGHKLVFEHYAPYSFYFEGMVGRDTIVLRVWNETERAQWNGGGA